jgi:hypothetical protein
LLESSGVGLVLERSGPGLENAHRVGAGDEALRASVKGYL